MQEDVHSVQLAHMQEWAHLRVPPVLLAFLHQPVAVPQSLPVPFVRLVMRVIFLIQALSVQVDVQSVLSEAMPSLAQFLVHRVLLAHIRLPLDNLSAHKVDGVAEAIKAAKAKIRYLPPYSPDLNPIELLFSKIKSMLRSEGNRTVETLWTSLGKIMNKIAPTECMNFIKHCGYKIFKLAATAN
jgi:transposase